MITIPFFVSFFAQHIKVFVFFISVKLSRSDSRLFDLRNRHGRPDRLLLGGLGQRARVQTQLRNQRHRR